MARARRSFAVIAVTGAAFIGSPSAAVSDVGTAIVSQRDERILAADGTAFLVTSAVVRVPQERLAGAPDATIDLAVVRARREGSTRSAAHVMLAGGPGDSGVALVQGMVRHGGARLAAVIDGDLIGIDQRGTGASVPSLAVSVRYGLPQDRAGSPELWLPLMEAAVRTVRADLVNRGIRLDAFNTRESAADVDAVRRSLGYQRVTLWGRSYGSHLALATLRLFPNTVERLVLIGPEGPNHTWKLPAHVDAVIERLAQRSSTPDLVATMRAVMNRLAASPVSVSIPNPSQSQPGQPLAVVVGSFDLQWVTAHALGDPRLLRTLPAAYRQMANGDFTTIARIVAAHRARAGIDSAMKHAMDTGSGATAGRRAQIEQQAKVALLGNAINFPGLALERAWGTADLGDHFRAPVVSAVPTLVLVGDLDPRTPVANAHEILSTLKQGRLVVVENATHHFDVFGSERVLAVLRRFLAGELRENERISLPSPG